MSETDQERNKRTVVAFFKRAVNEKQPEEAVAEHIGSVYIQHNPMAPDGAEAFVDFVRGAALDFPEMRVDIKRVLADGDLVAVHSHFTFAPEERGNASVDIFRLDQNGKIVEHWDVVQPVPESSANDNGMF
jgi:predicted SnoaL-like aldol condensation-catalyzing enzyme